jgi:DHA2 family multidrug resistance protein
MSEAAPVANRAAITVSLMLGTLMTSLDGTIVNVALPHIQGSLSAAADEIVWVLTFYIIAGAIVTPLSGWLANRFGQKSIFLIAIAGFTGTSLLCGLATGLPELVAFRFAQGAFGAFMLPISQSVLLDINPPSQHSRAMAIWGAGALMGSVTGPAVGGYITEVASWRWCFFVNLPVGALAFLGVWAFMPSGRRGVARPFDALGFGALIVAVAAFQLMLDRGPGQDWFSSREIWTEAIVSGCAFWVFLFHTLSTRSPFIDLAVVRDRNFVAACIFIFVVQAVIFGTLAIVPLITQSLMGYPVLLSGFVAMPRACGMLISMWAAPTLTARFGPRQVLTVGTLGSAFALWLMAQYDLTMATGPFLSAGLLQGLSQGFMMVPVMAVAFATLRPTDRPEAAALLNLVRSIGGAIGISMLQGLAAANQQKMHASLAAQVAPSDPMFRWAIGHAFSPDTLRGAESLNAEITRQATMVAYVDDFRLMFILCLLCTPLVLLLRSAKAQNLDVSRRAAKLGPSLHE